MINHDEVIDVANAMIAYGGSFVNSLGKLLQHADYKNQQKIKDTWPEYWQQYKEQANKKQIQKEAIQ